MTDLDAAILTAFDQIFPLLKSDPAELQRRLARRRLAILSRPPRSWSLAIRASDQRITEATALIVPEDALDPNEPDYPMPHTVTLDTQLLRRLSARITIDWPGEPFHDVARKLGVSPRALRNARIKGLFKTHYVKNHVGPPTPLLYTPNPLISSTRTLFALPNQAWGSQYIASQIPDHISQDLVRAPIFYPASDSFRRLNATHPEAMELSPSVPGPKLPPIPPDYVWYKWKDGLFLGDHPSSPPPKRKRHPRPSVAKGSLRFRGWRWKCPGCGRAVKTIYYPLPPLKLRLDPFITEFLRNHADQVPEPLPCFACKHCHNIQFSNRDVDISWNQIITHLTGGLLFGHEVPKPKWFNPQPQKRGPQRNPRIQTSPKNLKRHQVLNLWLKGLETRQIALAMRVHPCTINAHLRYLCRDHNVPTRAILAQLLNRQPLLAGSLATRVPGVSLQAPVSLVEP